MRFLCYQRLNPLAWPLRLAMILPLPCFAVHAQMHHVDAPEHVTRALGVYEWTGELSKPTAARFVPVSLFINGTLQDAGLYLARPVPFALQAGDIYSLEHAGEPQGLLDLDYAQHVVTSAASGDDEPLGAWFGYGKFTPQTAPKQSPLRPSVRLPQIQSDGKPSPNTDQTRPHMSRRGDATASTPTVDASGGERQPDAGDASKSSGTGGNGSATTGGRSTTADSDDTDRPTLRHRDPSQDATRRREYGNKSKQASVTGVGPAPGDDPDRPVLGRNTEADSGTPPLTGLPADMHQEVGVSDPVHRDGHNFAREWDTPAERTQVQSSLEAIARTRVTAYLASNQLVASAIPLPSETATPAVANRASAAASSTTAEKAAATRSTGPDLASATTDGETGAPPRLQRGIPSQYRAPEESGTKPATPPVAPKPATQSKNPPAPVARVQSRVTAHRRAGTSVGVAKNSPAALALAGSTLAGYTLSYGGLPTFVYTAKASVAKAASSQPAALSVAPAAGVPPPPPGHPAHPVVYVTVVAQRLPSGELQVVLTNVTDSLHLDRSPRLRLVDAVDPDDSHRASLLFELRGASSRQFALYRLTAAQAEQTFTTASIE